MDYKDFENHLVKDNRKLKYLIVIVLAISSISTTAVLMQNRFFIYEGGEIFKERLLAEEVCRIAFVSLTSDEPNSHVITDEILKIVKKDPFIIKVDKILKLYSAKKETCKIVLKSNGSLLAFKITLKSDDAFPFFYKLIQIDELVPIGDSV